MSSEREIQEWWNRKIKNCLKNYAIRNKLTLTQARTKFFTKTNEKFLEIVPTKPQKLLQVVYDQNQHTRWTIVDANLSNSGRTNLCEWFEKIVNKFYEEQAIKECMSFDKINSKFHDDFHESFLCTIPTMLFKFLIDKGVAHIVKPRPPLAIPYFAYWHTIIREWEIFIKEREWEYFLSK